MLERVPVFFFGPINSLMARLSIWNSGRKSNDYKFIDRTISEFFGASGTCVYLHKYLGPHDQRDPNEDGTPLPPVTLNERSIQDVLFLENRDRKYARDVYELRGHYNVADHDFDLKQFGIFLSGDTIYITFHMNDMLALVGRKIMPGDVIELPHLRDDMLLDENAPAINKFYVVDEASKASEGYSSTWYPHIWRVKMSPMHDAQEYRDILDQQAQNPFGIDQGRLGDILSSVGKELQINEEIVEQAKLSVPARNFETRHYWVVPGEGGPDGKGNPWIFCGDGTPPNGAVAVESSYQWPDNPKDGDYCLRTDYEPRTLFQYKGGVWRVQELDYRQSDWSAAHRILHSFINNDKSTTFKDGGIAPEKQSLHKAVKPRADF